MKQDRYQAEVAIEYSHHKIHEGQFFSAGEIAQSIASAGTLTYGIQTGSKTVHITPAYISTSADKMTFQVYEDSTYTGGTAVTAINRNRNFTNAPTMTGVKAPTVTVNGTLISQDYLAGATGVGQTRAGQIANTDNEIIFKPNTKYVIIYTNGSSSANLLTWSFSWYEA